MRVSITYLYTIFKYGYPHSVDDALRSLGEIRSLGFRFLELEGLGRENLQSLYARRAELARLVLNEGLHVHNFCVVDPEMVSVDSLIRRTALDRFRMGAEVAEFLNAETLHVASYAPPVDYLQTGRTNSTLMEATSSPMSPLSDSRRTSTGPESGMLWSSHAGSARMWLLNTTGP